MGGYGRTQAPSLQHAEVSWNLSEKGFVPVCPASLEEHPTLPQGSWNVKVQCLSCFPMYLPSVPIPQGPLAVLAYVLLGSLGSFKIILFLLPSVPTTSFQAHWHHHGIQRNLEV